MNIKKIININEAIKRVLPKKYPRPKLVLYEDEENMLEVNQIKESAFAVYDPYFKTINIPIKDTLELSDIDIAKLLLHEYHHAIQGDRYGIESKEYTDEKACDKFACRWVKKLNGVIKEIENKRFCGWRNEEIEYLRNHYPTSSKERIMKHLGRTWSAVQSKAQSIGVKRQ